MLVFADEPTSGLDAFSAEKVGWAGCGGAEREGGREQRRRSESRPSSLRRPAARTAGPPSVPATTFASPLFAMHPPSPPPHPLHCTRL